MKNVIIVLILIVGGPLAYFLLPSSDSQTSSTTNLVVSPAQAEESASASGALEKTTENDSVSKDATASLISKAPADASVYIIEPSNGATVTSPVTVKFGIKNMVVAKAGDNKENSGHHHLLINLEELPDLSSPLPATEQIVHFGGGQTETEIELAAGEHTLQLLLGNYLHIPHDEPVLSETITITVE